MRETGNEEELIVNRHAQMWGAIRLTLIVEAVYPVDGGALMVPSQQEKVLWVFNLVGQQQANGL